MQERGPNTGQTNIYRPPHEIEPLDFKMGSLRGDRTHRPDAPAGPVQRPVTASGRYRQGSGPQLAPSSARPVEASGRASGRASGHFRAAELSARRTDRTLRSVRPVASPCVRSPWNS